MAKTKKAQLVKGGVVPFGFDEEIEDNAPFSDDEIAHYNELAYAADLEYLAKYFNGRAA